MKKLFNHSKKEYDKDLEWEDAEYTEEDYPNEEDSAENGEYYEDETAEDTEYYEDESSEGGEYYEEESPEDGEYYEDDSVEDTEYYEDDNAQDGEYYEEGSGDEDSYYGDDSIEEDEYEDEEDGYYEEDDRKKKLVPVNAAYDDNIFSKLWNTLLHMSTMDRIVATTGVLVLILAIITGTVFASANLLNKQVASFQTVGNQLDQITLIGEHGLTAVADTELAKIQAANAIEEENTEYNETEFTKEVEVSMNMTSIEKDLKIKFVNSKTNKLIANVPFAVSVVTPGGKSETWTDDDMDGIIYKSDIKPGDYSVTLNSLDDKKYEDYTLPASAKKTTVRKEIAYQKVEVSDEMKDESEVNSKKEDTKENETKVESALKDTVTWVESTKTVLDATYTAVAKTSVNDPLATAKSGSFLRTAAITMTDLNLTIGEGGTNTGSVAVAVPEGFTKFQDGTVNYTSSQIDIATVDGSGNVTAHAVGTSVITFNAKGEKPGPVSSDPVVIEDISGSCTVTVTAASIKVTQLTLNKSTLSLLKGASETLTVTAAPDNASDKNVTWSSSDATVASVDASGKVTALKTGSATITATSVSDTNIKAQCTVSVTEPSSTYTLTLDKKTLSTAIGSPVVIKANVLNSVSQGDASATVTAVTDKPAVLDVTCGTNANGVIPITINPKAVGTATITVTANNGLTAVCTVTVNDRTMTLDKATLSVLSAAKKTINAEVPSIGGEFKVESSNSQVATATITATKGTDKTTAKIEITGVAAGSATITISHTENGVAVKKTCTVTVVAKENKLVDSQKRQLYVLQADGKYREATYADYYDASVTNFYLRAEGTVKYTGWQTLDGKLYYFDASGKKITGEQVIQGAKYSFASDGSLVVGSGAFGIDVSKWNGTIDWNAVKNSGVNYVIIRCGYRGSSTGALIVDPKFSANIKGATAAGIKVGVYFFSQAVNRNEAVEEASMVLEQIKKYTISYPVFLDVEGSGGRADGIDKATRTDVIKAFCETIQNGGYTAGVYANKSWLTNKIDTSQLGKYKIWLAQYASTPTYTGRYDMWQYKSTGKVTGISGNVDMNLSYLGY